MCIEWRPVKTFLFITEWFALDTSGETTTWITSIWLFFFDFLTYQLAICKSRNGESRIGMRGMMGTWRIKVGTRGTKIGMQGIRLGIRAIKTGMQEIRVGIWGTRVEMWVIRVRMRWMRVGMQGIRVRMPVYKYVTGIL